MEKKLMLSRIEVEADGTVFVKLCKQIVDDDGTTIFNSSEGGEPHRVPLLPGSDSTKVLDDVNMHLKQGGWPTLSQYDTKIVIEHTKLAQTPEVVKAYRKRVAEEVQRMQKAAAASTTEAQEGSG